MYGEDVVVEQWENAVDAIPIPYKLVLICPAVEIHDEYPEIREWRWECFENVEMVTAVFVATQFEVSGVDAPITDMNLVNWRYIEKR